MTAQTDRLQALLARVQENRHQSRGSVGVDGRSDGRSDGSRGEPTPHVLQAVQAAVPPPVYSMQQPAAQPAVVERTQPRVAEPRPAKPAATPLEMAVEGRLSAPVHHERAHAPAVHAAPQAQARAAAPAAPTSFEGVVLVDPQPMQPGRPVAQVVSVNPPSVAATFGELLRRSLSLRPR